MTNSDTLTRENLLQQIGESWNELLTYLASLTKEQLTGPTDAAGWTAKDHVIHIAVWEKAAIVLLERKSTREALDIPLEIWEQAGDPVNAILQQRDHNMPLAEVKQTLQHYHDGLLKKLDTMTEAELLLPYRHYNSTSTDERLLIQWLPSETIHHYREHIPWMAAIVEQA